MAVNKKVTELSLVTPSDDDLLYVVDDPSGTPTSKAATVGSTRGYVPLTLTGANAAAFAVGPNGNTNPTIRAVTNVALAATGVQITAAAAAGGVLLEAISSGSNEHLNLSGKGTGYVGAPRMNIGGGTFDASLTMTVRSVDNGDYTGIKILSLNEAVSLVIGRSGIQASNGMLMDTPACAFSGYLGMTEVSTPSAPGANGGRMYLDDSGGGKTRLMILFNSGAAQQIAIQP